MIVDELELDEAKSFEDIVRQISQEAQHEINYYKLYENRKNWAETDTEEDSYSSMGSDEKETTDWLRDEDWSDREMSYKSEN